MSKKFNPKVSIVIPVYNGSNYLKEAIDSALAQTYKNIEILVINDGSNDEGKTDKICKSYGDKIRYFKKENGGVATALNMGVEKMKGEYFSWLSHDDVYYPEKVESQVSLLSNLPNKETVIYSDYELIDNKGEHISFVNLDHEVLQKKREYALLRGSVSGITTLIPKGAFTRHGLFNEKLRCTQDYDLWFRFMETYNFTHMPVVITKTRIHEKQDSNTRPEVFKEGNDLWIHMIMGIDDKMKRSLERTEYNFYREMSIFLESTPYNRALRFVEDKMTKIYEVEKNKREKFKVTVIIPFYNRKDLLLSSLKSVIEQDYKNLEILLINDGSTQDLTNITEFIAKDERIKLINLKENMGPAFARNIGIENATGDYIAFLDSDDSFLRGKIKEQLLMMSLTNMKVSHTSYLRRSGRMDQLAKTGLIDGRVVPQIIGACRIATPTVMIERMYIEKNKFRFREDFRLGEDVCFWLEILRNEKLLGIPKAFTIVNVKASSASSNCEKQLQGLSNIIKFVLSDEEYSKAYREISQLCYGYYKLVRDEYSKNKGQISSDNTLWSNKPNNPLLKLLFLFKHQGVGTTIKKIVQKYFR